MVPAGSRRDARRLERRREPAALEHRRAGSGHRAASRAGPRQRPRARSRAPRRSSGSPRRQGSGSRVRPRSHRPCRPPRARLPRRRRRRRSPAASSSPRAAQEVGQVKRARASSTRGAADSVAVRPVRPRAYRPSSAGRVGTGDAGDAHRRGRRSHRRCAPRSRRTSRPSASPCVWRRDPVATTPPARLRRSKHKASHEAGIESRDHRFPADTPESDPRARRGAERGRRRRRDPRPTAASRAHGRGDDPPYRRSRQGRRRLPRAERRAALPGRAQPVPATPSGVMVMLAEHGVELKGKEAVAVQAQRDRRQADGDDAPRGARDGHDLPPRTADLKAAYAASGHPGRRRRPRGSRDRGHEQAGSGRRRRRDEPERGSGSWSATSTRAPEIAGS